MRKEEDLNLKEIRQRNKVTRNIKRRKEVQSFSIDEIKEEANKTIEEVISVKHEPKTVEVIKVENKEKTLSEKLKERYENYKIEKIKNERYEEIQKNRLNSEEEKESAIEALKRKYEIFKLNYAEKRRLKKAAPKVSLKEKLGIAATSEMILSNTNTAKDEDVTEVKDLKDLKEVKEEKTTEAKEAKELKNTKEIVDTVISKVEEKSKIDIYKENRAKKKEAKKTQMASGDNNKRPKASKGIFAAAIAVWSIIGIAFICGIVALVMAFNMLEGIPTLVLTDLSAPESSVIYDVNNEVVAELGEYKRENISYEDLPNVLVDAFVSIEDSRFFSHFGFDIPRFIQAAIENLRSGSFAQGGSTITMQLIKNTYFQIDDGENSTMAERAISRKFQEILLAIEADAQIEKGEILASYLNRINFGNNIRGIQKASQYYFGKNATDLDLSESAFLAGIINAPNANNPYNNLYAYKYDESNIYVSSSVDYLGNATQRRNEVLDMMVYHGYITEEECAMAKAIKLEDQLVGESDIWADTIPYYQSYIDAVINEAKELTGLDPTANAMQIYTNMDPYMQELVYNIQNGDEIIDWYRDDVQSAIVSMDNQTGAIVALGGGRNQTGSLNWNRATMSKIQPGSTTKPIFEYLLAFEELGWATSHTITDRPIYLYGSDHLIANTSGTYDGDMLMTEAVARSLNTPAIQTLQAVIDEMGEEYCVKFLNSIGIDASLDTFDLQYAIGGNTLQVTPVELAGAHAILFNGGKYIKPHTISRIVMADGTTYEADTEGNQVVSEGAAYLSAYLERQVVDGGYFNYTQILQDSYPVYAKTGTSDWGNSGAAYGIPTGSAKDSWLVCSTSNYTNVIWLGFDRAAQGTYFTSYDDRVNIKGQIGNILLDAAVEHYGYEATEVKRPDDVVSITHVMGLYPYIEPTVGTSVTGYIKSEYNKLAPAESITYEYRTGTLSGITTSVIGNSIDVYFNILSGSAEGTQDMTATSLSGKVTHAYGRLYFPRIIYSLPENATYYAELRVNGTVVDRTSTTETTATLSMPYDTSGTIEVCGSYSLSDEQFCQVVDTSGSSSGYPYDYYFDND